MGLKQRAKRREAREALRFRSDVTSVVPVAGRCWRVAIPDVEALVVCGCATAEEAFEQFKQTRGIVASEHRPTIEEVEQ